MRRLDLGVLAREPLVNGYPSRKYRPGSRITSRADWRSHRDAGEVEAHLDTVARIEAMRCHPDVPLARWALA